MASSFALGEDAHGGPGGIVARVARPADDHRRGDLIEDEDDLSVRERFQPDKRLLRQIIDTSILANRLVQDQAGEPTRREPRESVVVAHSVAGKPPVALDTVPSEQRRLDGDRGH